MSMQLTKNELRARLIARGVFPRLTWDKQRLIRELRVAEYQEDITLGNLNQTTNTSTTTQATTTTNTGTNTSTTTSTLQIGTVDTLSAGASATATITNGLLNLGIPTGAQGATGATGAAGSTGATGPAGPAGADSTVPGPAGADGADGATGPAGPAGPAGADGADGADGAQGPQGIQGIQGPAGPAGADGADGADGAQGPAGPQGPAGATGATGATGAAGADGADGADGAAATITVGTVTTGAEGSSATVTNSGTANAAVLDFSIPVGATGAQGPAGSGGGGTFSGSIADTQIAVGSGVDAIGGSSKLSFVSPNQFTLTTQTSDFPIINLSASTHAVSLMNREAHALHISDGSDDGTGLGSELTLAARDPSQYLTSQPPAAGQLRLSADATGTNSPLLRINTDSGYLRIGPQNSSFCHFYTDRTYFYFNRAIQFDAGQLFSYNDDFQIKTDDSGSGQPTRIFIDAGVDECRVGIGNGFDASTLPQTELHVNGEVTVNSLAGGGPNSAGGVVVVDAQGLMSVSRTDEGATVYLPRGQGETEPYTDLGGNFATPPASIQEAIERIATQLSAMIGGPIP